MDLEKKLMGRLGSVPASPSSLSSIMLFHAIGNVESLWSNKTIPVPASYKIGMRVAVAAQLVMDACMKSLRCAYAAKDTGVEMLKRCVQAYLFYDISIAQFQAPKSHTDGHASSIQRTDLSEDFGPAAAEKHFAVNVEMQSMDVVSACWHFVGFMKTYPHRLVKNVYPYSLTEDALFKWGQLEKCTVSGTIIP